MLVLSRKQGEGLLIGDDIKISIVEIKGKQVRVGVEAPSHFLIYREEVYTKILEANKEAVSPNAKGIEDLISTLPQILKGRGGG